MKVFEVTIRSGRTDTIRVEADSILDVTAIYDNLSDADIVQIKQVEYVNTKPNIINVPYSRELKVLVSNGTINRFYNLKFVKKLLHRKEVISMLKSFLLVDGKKISTVQGLTIWN